MRRLFSSGPSCVYGRLMVLRIVCVLLALVFLGAGGAKLAAVQTVVDEFRHFGHPPWLRTLVGAIEVAGGIGLLFSGWRHLAAVALIGIMGGAVWTLHSVGESLVPPLVVGAVLIVVAWITRPGR